MEKRGWLTVLLIFGGLFVMLVVFSIVVVTAFGDGDWGASDKIGVIEIKGPITSSRETLEDIRDFEEQDAIKGIVVRIDSPGGAVAPSQELYQAVRETKKTKPLAVSMGTTAASGGYYIACGADTIFANRGTVTGSIGVITQLFNVEEVLENLEIEVNTVKTGKYKDAGSPFNDFTEDEREYFADLLEDIYSQFVNDVAESRGLEVDQVKKYADGRVFTGQQAKEYKLVDKLGSFQDAVDYVKKEAGVEGDIELKYPAEEDLGFLSKAVEGVSDTVSNELKSRHTPLFEYRFVKP